MPALTQSALAAMIDHTLLKAEATRADIDRLCAEAREFGFATVCVHPFRTAQAAQALAGSDVKVCTVIGFPFGELDMVLNIGALKDGNFAAVENDIQAVVTAAQGRVVKVILETGLLTPDEIVRACELSVKGGARFVKTSTGYGPGGATVEHVRLMRSTVGKLFGVKASGGIRDRQSLLALIEAGANRIGTSHGVSLLREGSAGGEGY
jgi:deoxyribose-phosphate aldolase